MHDPNIRFMNADHKFDFVRWLELPTADGLVGLCKLKDGAPVMMIAGNNWTLNSGQVHQWCANPSFYSRGLVRAFAAWFFGPLAANRRIMLAPVRGDAPRTLDLNVRALGFRIVCTIKDGYEPSVDMHFLELRREDCTWLQPGFESFITPAEWRPS